MELGAGMGYWAKLLKKLRLDVVALDVDPPENCGVEYGTAAKLHFMPLAFYVRRTRRGEATKGTSEIF